jgi:hypothetical protein
MYVNEEVQRKWLFSDIFYENNIWKLIKQLRILDLKLKVNTVA